MIFNKDSKGSEELKDLIGFIYKSIRFDNMATYINMATRDIVKIIGKDVFKVALEHYESKNYNLSEEDEDHPEYETLDELVKKIQLPIALHAYRRYAPSNDLSHSDKGRQIFVSEEQKPAFEWQVEKDNANILSLAHESTDILLEFLEDHIDDKVGEEGSETNLLPWGESTEFEKSRELWLNKVDDFEKVFPIGGSRRILDTPLKVTTLGRSKLTTPRPF